MKLVNASILALSLVAGSAFIAGSAFAGHSSAISGTYYSVKASNHNGSSVTIASVSGAATGGHASAGAGSVGGGVAVNPPGNHHDFTAAAAVGGSYASASSH